STPTELETTQFPGYNICLETDLKQPEITQWKTTVFSSTIDSKIDVVKYLGYLKYNVELTDTFMEELLYWKQNNIKLFTYTLQLMQEVEEYPFTAGICQAENLKNRGKEASKRISNSYPDRDRLSYCIDNNFVKFISCKGHYKFH